MVKFIRKVIPLLLFFYSVVNAQSITVSASTDTSDYKVGDYIRYTLEIRHAKDVKLFLPPVKDSLKSLDYIESIAPQKDQSGDKVTEIFTYVFSKYDSSRVEIPSLKIQYTVGQDTTRKSIMTNPLTINVRTLPVNPQQDIKDVKQPMKIPLNWLIIIAAVLAALILISAGYYFYQKYRKKKAGEVAPEKIVKVPAHEIALSKLKDLEARQLWQEGMIKEYHSEITGIIREYFELRFGIMALEMPSSEIMMNLGKIADSQNIVDTTNDFLGNADLVKFAKFQPLPKVNEEMMKQAFTIVHNTIPAPLVEQKEETADVQ